MEAGALPDPADLVAEIAELGSIDAVLERHPKVSRDDVDAAVHRASSLLAADGELLPPTSPLLNAYNGFMLGLFIGASLVFEHRNEFDRRAELITRVTEFLVGLAHEHGVALEPESADNIEDAVRTMAGSLHEDLARYYDLALASFRCIVLGDEESDDYAGDLEEAERLLLELGHSPILLRATLESPNPGYQVEAASWQGMMTICLRMARSLVADLPPEPETCFVAMPFTEPFEERYLRFYRVIASRLGKRAFRAWGALGNENHQELLLALIAKSGALLAEVTVPNANVTLEVGFALGQSKDVYLVAEGERWRATANIQLDWVYPYEASEVDWEVKAADMGGMFFTALSSLRRPGPIPSWSESPIAILELLGGLMQHVEDEAGD